MKKTTYTLKFLALSLSLSIAACATPGRKTGIGAGGGAVAGGAVGAAAGGWKGAAIGAGIGAVAGGAVGNYLDRQTKELEKVADTKRTDAGVIVKLKNDLLFDTGSDVLKPEANQQLTQLGDILSKYPDDRIDIQGYTDSVGKPVYNEELSQRRAESVRKVLSDRGVSPKQLLAEGLGENKPVASNKTSTGRAKNRRVELHIDVPNNA